MAGGARGETERIARRIARAGVCSRRDAERLIAEGRVTVNGRRIDSPALNVGPTDAVTVNGEPLPEAGAVRLWRHHKRRGRITTARDPRGRPTVFDDLPAGIGRVISVGRLDFNTEGLLLLTNDGALARALELPATGWLRRYRVRVHGAVDEQRLAALASGITIEGIRYGPVEARLERRVGSNAWLEIGIREGKNREVRRVLEHLGLAVTRLIRVSFGPFQLGVLAPGATAEVPRPALREQLGGLLPGAGKEARPRLRAKAGKGRTRHAAGPAGPKTAGAARGPKPARRPSDKRAAGEAQGTKAAVATSEGASRADGKARGEARALTPSGERDAGRARPARPRPKRPTRRRPRQGHADHRRAP